MIDIRSDTVTKPTPEMRKAMAEAEVGDDVYGDDPTVNELERLAAAMVGKEAALFVPSGTFGNQLALFTWCKRGSEVILGEDCHIIQHEAGAASVLQGFKPGQYRPPQANLILWILKNASAARTFISRPQGSSAWKTPIPQGLSFPSAIWMRYTAPQKHRGSQFILMGPGSLTRQ